MGIRPQDFEVSVATLRERLHLTKDITIIPFGYEKNLDNLAVGILKTRYDRGSLFIRTRPDFFVIDSDELYLVEAKQKTKNVEAIQLLYNKNLERMGIKVLYSFPEFTIHASQIPIDEILVPEDYRVKFNINLKHLFKSEGDIIFTDVGMSKGGSGDAFVPIDVEDLKLLAEEY